MPNDDLAGHSAPLRVLMVTTSFPSNASDSSGSFIANLALALRAAAVDVRIVTTGPADSGGVATDGIPVVRVADLFGITGKGGSLPRIRSAPWRVFAVPLLVGRLWQAVRRHAGEVDVVHAHWLVPAGLVAAFSGRPFVATAHGSDVSLAERFTVLRPMFRFICLRAHRVLAVSEGMRMRLAGIGIPAERIDVVRMPLRPSLQTDAHIAKESARPFTIGFVGSLTRNKGVHHLLEAFGRAAIPGARLEIIGGGPEAGSLKRAASELGIVGMTRFLGEVAPSEVDDALGRLDVLVLPSTREGFGLVLAEATLAGAAVIASDIPGPKDLVVDGVTGLLVAPGDTTALAAAIRALADDAERRARFVQAGRQRLDALGMSTPASVAGHIAAYQAARSTPERG